MDLKSYNLGSVSVKPRLCLHAIHVRHPGQGSTPIQEGDGSHHPQWPEFLQMPKSYGNDCKLHNIKYTIGLICMVLLLPVYLLGEESTDNRIQLRQGELEQKERGGR